MNIRLIKCLIFCFSLCFAFPVTATKRRITNHPLAIPEIVAIILLHFENILKEGKNLALTCTSFHDTVNALGMNIYKSPSLNFAADNELIVHTLEKYRLAFANLNWKKPVVNRLAHDAEALLVGGEIKEYEGDLNNLLAKVLWLLASKGEHAEKKDDSFYNFCGRLKRKLELLDPSQGVCSKYDIFQSHSYLNFVLAEIGKSLDEKDKAKVKPIISELCRRGKIDESTLMHLLFPKALKFLQKHLQSINLVNRKPSIEQLKMDDVITAFLNVGLIEIAIKSYENTPKADLNSFVHARIGGIYELRENYEKSLAAFELAAADKLTNRYKFDLARLMVR